MTNFSSLLLASIEYYVSAAFLTPLFIWCFAVCIWALLQFPWQIYTTALVTVSAIGVFYGGYLGLYEVVMSLGSLIFLIALLEYESPVYRHIFAQEHPLHRAIEISTRGQERGHLLRWTKSKRKQLSALFEGKHYGCEVPIILFLGSVAFGWVTGLPMALMSDARTFISREIREGVFDCVIEIPLLVLAGARLKHDLSFRQVLRNYLGVTKYSQDYERAGWTAIIEEAEEHVSKPTEHEVIELEGNPGKPIEQLVMAAEENAGNALGEPLTVSSLPKQKREWYQTEEGNLIDPNSEWLTKSEDGTFKIDPKRTYYYRIDNPRGWVMGEKPNYDQLDPRYAVDVANDAIDKAIDKEFRQTVKAIGVSLLVVALTWFAGWITSKIISIGILEQLRNWPSL